MASSKTFFGVALALVALALLLVALGVWLLVTGIVGVMDDGATTWEVFKIVLGALLVLGSISSRTS